LQFTGSGGAILGLFTNNDEEKFAQLVSAYEKEGFEVSRVIPNVP